jgi:hypothetical protein
MADPKRTRAMRRSPDGTPLATLRGHTPGINKAVFAGLDDGCFTVTAEGIRDVDGWALIPSNDDTNSELGFLRARAPDDIDLDVDGRRVMRVLRRHPIQNSNSAGASAGQIQTPC